MSKASKLMERAKQTDEQAEQTEPAVVAPDSDQAKINGLPKRDLLRVDEVADYFNVTDRTIRLWIDHGHLEIEKLAGSIRVLKTSVQNFRLRSKIMG